MRSTLLRSVATAAAIALATAGCGFVGGQSLSSSDEVVAALRALADSSLRARVTAEVTVDEGEIRDAVQRDERLLSLMDDEPADGATTDDLLAELEQLRTELAQHALLLERGDDRSVRLAVESQGTVWADVRARGAGEDAITDDGLAASYPAELQLHVDWEQLDGMLEDSSVVDDITAAGATLRAVAPDLAAGVPAMQPILDVVLGFLDGDDVGFTGEIDTAAWKDALGPVLGPLGLDGSLTAGTAPVGELPDLDAYIGTALTFDGFRSDGGRTLVDVTVHVRELAAQLARDAEAMSDGSAPSAASAAATEKLAELEASLDELPEELTDVATLAFDGDGVLEQLRVDLFAIAVQAGAAAEPDDAELQALAGAADVFEDTGAFIVVDVTEVGGVDTVLGAPTTTATWDDVLGALQGAAGMLGPMFGAMTQGMPDTPPAVGTTPLSVTGLGVRDCFDDAAVDGSVEGDAPRVLPCAVPHDNEVFAVVPFAGEDRATAAAAAYDACLDAFESAVGSDYLESELFFAVLEPSETELADGVDDAVCYAFGPSPRTGSITGSGV